MHDVSIDRNNEILDKFSNIIKKGFDIEPVYNYKYLKTRIKAYEAKINIIFHNNKVPIEVSHCICLSKVLIDSVFKMGENYYLQVF